MSDNAERVKKAREKSGATKVTLALRPEVHAALKAAGKQHGSMTKAIEIMLEREAGNGGPHDEEVRRLAAVELRRLANELEKK